MIQFGRVFDRGTDADRRKLVAVQDLFRRVFPREAEYADEVERELNERSRGGYEPVLLTAEDSRSAVIGFAYFYYFPGSRLGYLNYIGSDPDRARRGIGRALYESVREYLLNRGAIGLLIEFAPDDPAAVSDPHRLPDNRLRARFYESFGARPVFGTRWQDPPAHPGYDPPHLAYDSLGRERRLRRSELRAGMQDILKYRYHRRDDDPLVRIMTESINADPVPLRPPRYQPDPNPVPAFHGKLTPIKLLIPKQHAIHHIRQRGYVERPARVDTLLKALQDLPVAENKVHHFGEDIIRAVHAGDYVSYLRRATENLGPKETIYPEVFPLRRPHNRPREMAIRAGYYCIDTFTPLSRAAYQSARAAVDCAASGAHLLLNGEHIVYALCRPPGHHAEHHAYGGFCYFNNAAIAAQILSRRGRVAILDIDYHAGNGQQDIFYRRSDVLTLSLHGRPRDHYPYFSGYADERGEADGKGFNRNYPLADLIGNEQYLRVLNKALASIRDYRPDWLVVALGYDTMRGDPTGNFDLTPAALRRVGESIGNMKRPTLIIQEGGYALGNLRSGARAFFSGLVTSWYGPD